MISVAEMKKHLNIEHITADDAYLADLEATAVAVVERWTGKTYPASAERTQYVRGLGIDSIWLAHEPTLSDPIVAEDMTVTERSAPGGEGTVLTVAEDFVVRGTALVRVGGYWTAGYEYEVTYTSGYGPGAEPEDVRGAVRDMVALWYTNRTPSEERELASRALLASLPSSPVFA